MKLPRGVPKAMRLVCSYVPGKYHWARSGEVSGCPLMDYGDVSTDAYPWIVNCKRCKKLKSLRERVAALRGLAGAHRTRVARMLAAQKCEQKLKRNA